MKFTRVILFSTAFITTSSAILYAASENSSQFNVNITIKESCNISTAAGLDLDFGQIDRASKDASANNNLAVTCTQGTPYRVALQSPRVMVNGQLNAQKIPYLLYQDANQTKQFNDDIQNTYSNTGTGNTQKIPVWGQVKQKDTNVPAGSYSDKVIVAITY